MNSERRAEFPDELPRLASRAAPWIVQRENPVRVPSQTERSFGIAESALHAGKLVESLPDARRFFTAMAGIFKGESAQQAIPRLFPLAQQQQGASLVPPAAGGLR